VVAGRAGWEVEPIRQAGADLTHRGLIRWLDYVPDEDLPALYAGAVALVYPSWYEGFGLPVLEALAVGIPVVISAAPALVELAGVVAEIADAAEPDALADAIVRASTVESRSEPARIRRQIVARGYSWAASGRRLARLWRDHLW
jgi:alpha-1,3-rhamnosyl/mannosyltransferase